MEEARSPCEQLQRRQPMDMWERLVAEVLMIFIRRHGTVLTFAKLRAMSKTFDTICKEMIFQLWDSWHPKTYPAYLEHPRWSYYKFYAALWKDFHNEKERERVRESYLLLFLPP